MADDPLAPLLPYHLPRCLRREYGVICNCDCGLDAALAEVRASVPTISDEERDVIASCQTERTNGRLDLTGVCLLSIIEDRFPDLGDQDG